MTRSSMTSEQLATLFDRLPAGAHGDYDVGRIERELPPYSYLAMYERAKETARREASGEIVGTAWEMVSAYCLMPVE